MREGLSIGEFSRITHLTVRMLRRYHDGGLLEPAHVDPATGYRSYSLGQVPTAQAIARFRALGLPVAELRDLLGSAGQAERDAVLATHLDRLEQHLDETRAAIVALRRLLDHGSPAPAVELRTLPARSVLAVRGWVTSESVLAWYDAATAELRAARRAFSGPPGGRYDHALFTDGAGEALVYLPTPPEHLRDTGRVRGLVLDARRVAAVTHVGPHDDIDLSYAALGSYVVERGLDAPGPVEEVYVVGPVDDPDPTTWRTEIAWPVTAAPTHGAGRPARETS